MKKILITIAMVAVTVIAFSQECFEVLQPTTLFKQPDNTYTLSIRYNTTGNKALQVMVICGNNLILDTCFINNGNGTKIYSGLACPTGPITAMLIPKTGSCSGAECGVRTIVIPTEPDPGTLPVKLKAFSALRNKNLVLLNWNTEFEIESKEFEIQRAEGNDFRTVGTITSNGNSTTSRHYTFNDKNENVGVTYYRLKNIDLNGKFTYSEIRTVKGLNNVNEVIIFPNPVRSNSKVSVVGATANSSIQLLDFSGKVLKNMLSNSFNSLDLSSIKNGTYLIRIIDKTTNEVVNKKLTVSN